MGQKSADKTDVLKSAKSRYQTRSRNNPKKAKVGQRERGGGEVVPWREHQEKAPRRCSKKEKLGQARKNAEYKRKKKKKKPPTKGGGRVGLAKVHETPKETAWGGNSKVENFEKASGTSK